MEAQAPSLGSFEVEERKKETLTFKNASFRSVDWFVGLKICFKFEPNLSKNRLVGKNAVTRIYGSCSLLGYDTLDMIIEIVLVASVPAPQAVYVLQGIPSMLQVDLL